MENRENIIGITKVRNESKIIEDTLRHYIQFCYKIIIYDDDSTDDTVSKINKFREGKSSTGLDSSDIIVIRWDRWSPENRDKLESKHRQIAFDESKKYHSDFTLIFDADERIHEFPKYEDYKDKDSVRMRFFDAYITPMDVLCRYDERDWFGIECRDILNLIRTKKIIWFNYNDARIPLVDDPMRHFTWWFVKHYWKAISIKEWEDACDYYMKWWKYKDKWQERKWKAIHYYSDFKTPLIPWDKLIQEPKIWRFV